MENDTTESSKMIKDMVTEDLNGLMEECMLVNGKEVNNMVKEYSSAMITSQDLENGKMVKELDGLLIKTQDFITQYFYPVYILIHQNNLMLQKGKYSI